MLTEGRIPEKRIKKREQTGKQVVPPEMQSLSDENSHSNGDILLSAQDVSKCYHLYNRPLDRLKEQLLSSVGKRYGKEFWALRGVSFQIRRGETFGIIGKNGSGKSTLLQIIAGILKPTDGFLQVNGKVAALLELGSGFNPDFTGRDNVYLNGSILGLSRIEIEQRFQEIVDFADIGPFIDQPVKSYSSGMFVRLAFAVATSVNAELLLIDEALAVGDVFFRQKCYRRLEELRRKGTSIILVSHSMVDVEQFCEKALLLDRGRQVYLGKSTEAVKHYYLLEQEQRVNEYMSRNNNEVSESGTTEFNEPEVVERMDESFTWPVESAFFDIEEKDNIGNGWAFCTRVAICDQGGQPCQVFSQGQQGVFYYEFEINRDIEVPIGGLVIHNDKGIIVHGKNTLQYGTSVPRKVRKGSRIRFCQAIRFDLAVGEYTFMVALAALDSATYNRRGMMPHQDLEGSVLRLANVQNAGSFAIVFKKQGDPVQLQHHGLCDLPGECRVQILS
ncbi:ATP-binding cassette domain-containing protein [Heliobacterium gestii]|uniref:ATP-binding cassette domain-containing protein n=1 Tax=Heliomicrobium gestii TaxID=2699 RepID=A0A845LCM7_HELGE|nr:ABC transporter ATP-binding protein [Heliomicrobium gestii]MBM7866606.1 ABC-type polysaccharide/polyol phosphate transport system ATPase subunit [Heliomicrobium gestii]MZP43114.1 ATP-binding cassette domain-containing protein [Heliomicrobium gestii]